jgi:4'-phosphopantetheinyl transferase
MCTWSLPLSPQLKRGEIHVWRANLAAHKSALRSLEKTLAPEECAKARRFRRELDRDRYVFAHGFLRSILARYLRTKPGEIVFSHGPDGKPELASGAVRFNMSHSNDLVVCAISGGCHVGIDVERVRPGVDRDVAKCFSPRGLQILEALPQPARWRTFFQGWTRMEACCKAFGEGLDVGLGAFDVFVDARNPVLLPPLRKAGQERVCWLGDLSPRRGYVGALATREENYSLRYWEWRADDAETRGGSMPSQVQPALRNRTL